MPDRPIKLRRWNESWRLIGDNVQCSRCGRAQDKRYRAKPFVHAADCPAKTDEPQLPWRDLHDILHSIFGVDQ